EGRESKARQAGSDPGVTRGTSEPRGGGRGAGHPPRPQGQAGVGRGEAHAGGPLSRRVPRAWRFVTARSRRAPGFAATLAAVLIYAVAMGWFEAVVVVYLRELLHIGRAESIPPADEVHARLRSIPWLLSTEQGREAATIVMLAAVGWLSGRTVLARLGAFIAAFGAW